MIHKSKNSSSNHEDLFSKKYKTTNGLKKVSINLNINNVNDTNSDYIDTDDITDDGNCPSYDFVFSDRAFKDFHLFVCNHIKMTAIRYIGKFDT